MTNLRNSLCFLTAQKPLSLPSYSAFIKDRTKVEPWGTMFLLSNLVNLYIIRKVSMDSYVDKQYKTFIFNLSIFNSN